MQLGIVPRLLQVGHQCVVFNRSQKAVNELVQERAIGSSSLQVFVTKLEKPRLIWLMVPEAAVGDAISGLLPFLEGDDIFIEGGNSYYADDIRCAKELAPDRIRLQKKFGYKPDRVVASAKSNSAGGKPWA